MAGASGPKPIRSAGRCSASRCAVRRCRRPPPLSDQVVHVIDDDDAVRESLSFVLGAAGLPSETYDSAEQFLASIRRDMTGCIITDVRMAEVNGIELVRRLHGRGVT